VIDIPTFSTATIIFLTLAGVIVLGLISKLVLKAKQGMVGIIKYSGTSSLIWLMLFWLMITLAAYTMTHRTSIILIGTAPLVLFIIFKLFSKRRKKYENQTY